MKYFPQGCWQPNTVEPRRLLGHVVADDGGDWGDGGVSHLRNCTQTPSGTYDVAAAVVDGDVDVADRSVNAADGAAAVVVLWAVLGSLPSQTLNHTNSVL